MKENVLTAAAAPIGEVEFCSLRKTVRLALNQIAADHPDLERFTITAFGSPTQLEHLVAALTSVAKGSA